MKADLKKQATKITEILFKTYPNATCALTHHDPFQLAIATILSAQCTDERVNIVTKSLFKKYRTPKAFAEANPEEMEEDIKSTGFYKNKAKSILGFSKAITEQFDSKVPQDFDILIKLPGVGRKTANVILGTGYGLATGVVVDTHVSRLSQRMGLTTEEDPVKIERDLMELLPQEDWINFSHAMIWHGRQICNARKPKCDECPLAKDCAKVGV
jgi:endonuclease III